MSCVFCEIVVRRRPASIVYEDDVALAFMNLRQANHGHVLVIPKMHVVTVDSLPLEIAGPLFKAAVRVARAVQATFTPLGLSLWQSNGIAAGQEVPHVHIHILPRRPGDGAIAFYQQLPPIEQQVVLDYLASQIRCKLEEDAHS
ncbi:MAG: HIT domain-containing protein [Anaerolineae bacterium]|nr:HIT domain-containing protein [Anaerolineae bacterium]